jgi:hypothetical protein
MIEFAIRPNYVTNRRHHGLQGDSVGNGGRESGRKEFGGNRRRKLRHKLYPKRIGTWHPAKGRKFNPSTPHKFSGTIFPRITGTHLVFLTSSTCYSTQPPKSCWWAPRR